MLNLYGIAFVQGNSFYPAIIEEVVLPCTSHTKAIKVREEWNNYWKLSYGTIQETVFGEERVLTEYGIFFFLIVVQV